MSFLCAWTQQEDDFLKKVVPQGKKNWIEVSKAFNQKFDSRNKSPKQCRERFVNYSYLGHNHLNSEWAQKDYDNLFMLYEKYGSKWRKISSHLSQKSENSIKNKFYGSIRKFVRKLNLVGKTYSILKKQMKEKSVLRVLDSHLLITLPENLKQKSILLKNKLLRFSKGSNIEISDQQLILLIEEINSFNLQSRSYKFWCTNIQEKKTQQIFCNKNQLITYQKQKNQEFQNTEKYVDQSLNDFDRENSVNKQQELIDLSKEDFYSVVEDKDLVFQLIDQFPIKNYSQILGIDQQGQSMFHSKNLF